VSKAREQVAKEQRICRLLRSGMSPARVAEMFNLTDRRVRQIRANWRDVDSLPPMGIKVDSGAEIQRVIDRLELIEEELIVLTEQTSHDGVRLGALRDRRETEVLLMQLKAELGLIPRNLAAPSLQQEVVGMVREIADALRRKRVDEAIVRDVLAVAERAPVAELEAAA
jgi:hypothetical protein